MAVRSARGCKDFWRGKICPGLGSGMFFVWLAGAAGIAGADTIETMTAGRAGAPGRAGVAAILGFDRWPADRQQAFVNANLSNPRLSPEVRAFFTRSLGNREMGLLLRNNMAQCLHVQERKDRQLWRVFLRCLDDPEEDRAWRILSVFRSRWRLGSSFLNFQMP